MISTLSLQFQNTASHHDSKCYVFRAKVSHHNFRTFTGTECLPHHNFKASLLHIKGNIHLPVSDCLLSLCGKLLTVALFCSPYLHIKITAYVQFFFFLKKGLNQNNWIYHCLNSLLCCFTTAWYLHGK